MATWTSRLLREKIVGNGEERHYLSGVFFGRSSFAYSEPTASRFSAPLVGPGQTHSLEDKHEEGGVRKEREAPCIAALMGMGANVKIPKHTHAGVVSRSAHERY